MPHLRLLCLSALLAPGCIQSTPDAVDVPTVPGLFTVGDFISGDGIEDLQICLMNTDTCDRTDSDGSATLSVPAEADIAITIAGGGYTPTLFALITTSDELTLHTFLAPLVVPTTIANGHGIEIDTDLGHLVSLVVDGNNRPVEGYAATVSAGEGPYFMNDIGSDLDLELTETSASARVFAMNIEAESVTLTLDGPNACRPADYYWQAGLNEARLPVLAGFASSVLMRCE